MAWGNGTLAIKVTQQTGDLTNTTDSSKATAHRNGTRLIIIAIPKLEHPNFLLTDDAFYATEAFNDYAVEFIDQAQQKDNPYFLYLAHSAPHFPLHAPAETRDSYLDIYRRGWDILRRERYARQKESGLATENWQFTPRSIVPIEENDAIANGYSGKQNPAWEDLPQDRRGGPRLPHGGLCGHDRAHRSRHRQNY